MPTISRFYGIRILMRLTQKDHYPPHIHAFYGEYNASVNINNGEIIQGKLPKTAERLVKEFIELNKTELLAMWESGIYKKLEGIK